MKTAQQIAAEIKALPKYPMVQELQQTFMSLSLFEAAYKTGDASAVSLGHNMLEMDPICQILVGRLKPVLPDEWMPNPAPIILVSALSKGSPGTAILYLTVLFDLALKLKAKATITDLVATYFSLGFPSEAGLSNVWQGQKCDDTPSNSVDREEAWITEVSA